MKLFYILACASLILFLFCPAYIQLKAKKGKTPDVIALKALSTLIAVLFALIGTVRNPCADHYWILTGLVLGMLGDILLEYIVPLGGLSFGLGNLIYVYCLIKKTSVHWYHLILLVLFLILAVRTFAKDIKQLGSSRFLYLPYGFVVAVMGSLSTSYMTSSNPSASLFGFGAFLFAISDFLLAYRVVHDTRQTMYTTSLGVYYMAQFCIGLSVFVTIW